MIDFSRIDSAHLMYRLRNLCEEYTIDKKRDLITDSSFVESYIDYWFEHFQNALEGLESRYKTGIFPSSESYLYIYLAQIIFYLITIKVTVDYDGDAEGNILSQYLETYNISEDDFLVYYNDLNERYFRPTVEKLNILFSKKKKGFDFGWFSEHCKDHIDYFINTTDIFNYDAKYSDIYESYAQNYLRSYTRSILIEEHKLANIPHDILSILSNSKKNIDSMYDLFNGLYDDIIIFYTQLEGYINFFENLNGIPEKHIAGVLEAKLKNGTIANNLMEKVIKAIYYITNDDKRQREEVDSNNSIAENDGVIVIDNYNK